MEEYYLVTSSVEQCVVVMFSYCYLFYSLYYLSSHINLQNNRHWLPDNPRLTHDIMLHDAEVQVCRNSLLPVQRQCNKHNWINLVFRYDIVKMQWTYPCTFLISFIYLLLINWWGIWTQVLQQNGITAQTVSNLMATLCNIFGHQIIHWASFYACLFTLYSSTKLLSMGMFQLVIYTYI